MKGIDLQQLEPNTVLIIETIAAIYQVKVVNPIRGEVVIIGGLAFPTYTDANFVDPQKNIQVGEEIEFQYKYNRTGKFRKRKTDPIDSIEVVDANEHWSYELEE